MAIQDEVIGTRNYRKYIVKDGSIGNDNCRLCGKASETIHVTGACEKLVGKEYKERHDDVTKVVHGLIAQQYIQGEREPYYLYTNQLE